MGGSDEEWTPSHSGSSSRTHTVSRYKSPKESLKRKAHDSEGSFFKKQKKLPRVSVILESFESQTGVGEKLHGLLPNHLDSADAVAAFLLFVHERQKTWKKKYMGRQTLTKNNILLTQWFTNMYR